MLVNMADVPGLIGLGFVLASFLVKSRTKLPLFNCIGSCFLATYSYLLSSWIFLLVECLVVIATFRLWRHEVKERGDMGVS